MAQQPSQQEPTMEEILASIRRIISEDAEEPAKESAPAPQPARARQPEPEPEPEPMALEEEEVLELDQIVEEEAPVPEMHVPEPPPPRPAVQMRAAPLPHPRAPEPAPAEEEDVMLVDRESDSRGGLLSQTATSAMANAFGQLHTRQRVAEEPGTTLEDIVRAMLKPLLQDWLETNLPPLVERLVTEEIERAQRQAKRR
jgi:cell pole-organizing protein PopZ